MKYRNRVRVPIYFERADLEQYREAALDARPNVDFSAWVNAQCARAVKRDGRKPGDRVRITYTGLRDSNRVRKAAKGE